MNFMGVRKADPGGQKSKVGGQRNKVGGQKNKVRGSKKNQGGGSKKQGGQKNRGPLICSSPQVSSAKAHIVAALMPGDCCSFCKMGSPAGNCWIFCTKVLSGTHITIFMMSGDACARSYDTRMVQPLSLSESSGLH